MTQTIQPFARVSLSKEGKDLSENKKTENEVNLSLLFELSEDLNNLNGMLSGLDYEMEKKIMELDDCLKKLGEIK